MKPEAIKLLIWMLGQMDRRICALEMISEGTGEDTCRSEIDELEALQRQTDGPESAPEAT